jgi:hypothetical protein
MTTENTDNVEDNKLYLLMIVGFLIPVFFCIFRFLSLMILRRHVAKGASTQGRAGHSIRLWLILFPALLPLLLSLRATTHRLNNSCAELVPLSFFIIALIHSSLLVYQMRAVLPTHFDSLLLRFNSKLGRLYLFFFVIVSLPPFIGCLLAYIYGVGIPKEGVCTYGGQTIGGYSVWVLNIAGYEVMLVICNMIAEWRLRKTIIHYFIKRELFWLTRTHTAMVIWDILFRFNLADMAINAAAGKDSEAAVVMLTIYRVLFALTYTGILGAGNAYILGAVEIRFLGLHRIWTLRWWRLLFRLEHLDPELVEALASMRVKAQLKHMMMVAATGSHKPLIDMEAINSKTGASGQVA